MQSLYQIKLPISRTYPNKTFDFRTLTDEKSNPTFFTWAELTIVMNLIKLAGA